MSHLPIKGQDPLAQHVGESTQSQEQGSARPPSSWIRHTEGDGQEWTDALEYIVDSAHFSMPGWSQKEEHPEGSIEAEEQERPEFNGGECLAQRK
jgi:hypothetical protein